MHTAYKALDQNLQGKALATFGNQMSAQLTGSGGPQFVDSSNNNSCSFKVVFPQLGDMKAMKKEAQLIGNEGETVGWSLRVARS